MNRTYLNLILGAIVIMAIAYFAFFTPHRGSYTVREFHGQVVTPAFSFSYPSTWHNEGQYFSSQPIEYYDLYSVKAPVSFDLVRKDIFPQTELTNQINSSARRAPDARVTIDGRAFTKYDLTDYGSYGGESAGRVIIYVGPEIMVGDAKYILIFHWEEKPLTETIPGNDPALFEKMVMSLTFMK